MTERRHRDPQICAFCQTSFLPQNSWQRFCSRRCQADSYYLRAGTVSAYPHATSSTVGAIAEYRVVIDLLGKGYEVFKACSPACSCDLIATRKGEIHRLEVRTANRNQITGVVQKRRIGFRADGFAWVVGSEIIYEPRLEDIQPQNIAHGPS
jgi:hypothetical protein